MELNCEMDCESVGWFVVWYRCAVLLCSNVFNCRYNIVVEGDVACAGLDCELW